MGLLYTRSIRLAIEKRFLCDAICLLVYFHRAEEASERASIGLTRGVLLSTGIHSVSPAIPASMVR
jgi:hypothetical protein